MLDDAERIAKLVGTVGLAVVLVIFICVCIVLGARVLHRDAILPLTHAGIDFLKTLCAETRHQSDAIDGVARTLVEMKEKLPGICRLPTDRNTNEKDG